MTSTTISLYPEASASGTAIEWKDVDKNPFFYDSTGQATAPTASSNVNATIKSIKNDTGYILVWIKGKNVGSFTGSMDTVDLTGSNLLFVLPNTTCSNTAWNWVIGLGVGIIVILIILVALVMSGVLVWHGGEGGAGFGYNNNR